MKIVVLIKQVPDMEKVKFDHENGRIDRASAGAEVNPFDLNALEAAVQIKDALGCRVIALSMGPQKARDALTEAVARGADEGILLSDAKFGGSDVKATALTLAAAIRKIGEVSLVFAGIQTVDGDTGQVGPEVAEYLGIPHISNVEEVRSIGESSIDAVTNVWDGLYLKKALYPALLCFTKDANDPRLPTFKTKMASRKADIPVWGIEQLKEFTCDNQMGAIGSPTKVKRIEIPPLPSRESRIFRDNHGQAVREVVDVFKKIGVCIV